MNRFVTVSSKDNPLIKRVSALQSSAKQRREEGLFVLEGLRICSDAQENGCTLEYLIVSDGAAGKYAEQIRLFSDSAVHCVSVPDALFRRISDTDSPQGVLALVRMPERQALPAKNGRYIGLENLADPTNLGAVARTAEALGVSGILMTRGSCDPYSPKAMRASMGTLLRVPLFFTDDIIALAKETGLRCLACVVDADAAPLHEIAFADGDLLLIGNEANGLTEATKQAAQVRLTIPMRGRAESLNAAAAAAIAMWEMMHP